MHLTDPNKKEIKELCEKSLKALCQGFLGYTLWDSVHDDVEIMLRKPSQRKAILLPRDHSKSTFVTIAWSIQQVIKNPNIRILIANGVWDNSRKFLREIKDQFEKSQLKFIYGDFVSNRWSADDIIVAQRTKAHKEPTIATTGVEAESVGMRADIIIADDLMGEQNYKTPEQREKVKHFRRSLVNILEPGGIMVDIMTRWHLDDTFTEIQEKESAYYDTMVRQVVENGKLIYPKKFSKKFDPVKKSFVPAPEDNCLDYVDYLKKTKPLDEFMCTPGETPILMSDWKTKPIEHVRVGDEIVGFTLGQGRKNGGLVKSRVKRTFSKEDDVLRLIMKSGRTVLCTKDHRWYTGRPNDPTHPAYAPAKVGTKLQFVCPCETAALSGRELMDWNYLAGLFDGEGSTKSGGNLTLSQCQSVNGGVYKEMTAVLDRLGIKYGENVRQLKDEDTRNYSPGNTHIWLRDSFLVGLNLIRNTPCGKSPQLSDRFFRFGKKFVREEDEVVDIRYDSRRTVYALETETGNYIAWGYASSNSQYMNDPISSENQVFKQEMFKYWNQRPEGLYVGMAVDLAISQRTEADYTAISVMGMDKEFNLYLLDYIRGHWGPTQIIDNIFQMQSRWKPNAVGMETNGFQRTLKEAVEMEQRTRKQYFGVAEIRNGPEKSKENRIKSLEPFYRQGKVFHAAWMNGKDMETELLTFPKGRHDDIIDSMAMVLPLLSPGVGLPQTNQIQEFSWEWWFRQADQPRREFFNRGV